MRSLFPGIALYIAALQPGLAVTGTVDGKNVEWMEKVSDEQYNKR